MNVSFTVGLTEDDQKGLLCMKGVMRVNRTLACLLKRLQVKGFVLWIKTDDSLLGRY